MPAHGQMIIELLSLRVHGTIDIVLREYNIYDGTDRRWCTPAVYHQCSY